VIGKVSDAEKIEHLLRYLDVLGGRCGKQIYMYCSAHQDDIPNGERKNPKLGLRHVAEDTG
jgi:hypothetical protein